MIYLNADSFKKIKFKKINSTNSYLRKNYDKLKSDFPIAVYSESQSNGRGREERVWHSAESLGIYCSVGIDLQNIRNINFLSLAVGIAVSEFLTQLTGKEFTLKWPNDVLFRGKKIAGILIENIIFDMEISSIIGVGININHSIEDFPDELKNTVSSIKMIDKTEYRVDELYPKILNSLIKWINILENKDVSLILKRFNELSKSLFEKKITFHYNGVLVEGDYCGIGNDGGIIIKDNKDNEKTYYSGEILEIKR